ncbi:hypothetical protein IMCC3317_07750 [Kordia antarctica]|uniref:Uncharacterized protein n=1 Tax=Kordia antarctica TaxID=1218801 RepID=A0A7L4ZG15_9FLAO|nr:hypothetical protein [Kordia antarctica]QHI35429.1 hypothetical protein IMCC3317_07750 [Kordia antarctica]
MKKKKLKTLRLNKNSISVFDSILGGRANCSDGETCVEPVKFTEEDVPMCYE